MSAKSDTFNNGLLLGGLACVGFGLNYWGGLPLVAFVSGCVLIGISILLSLR